MAPFINLALLFSIFTTLTRASTITYTITLISSSSVGTSTTIDVTAGGATSVPTIISGSLFGTGQIGTSVALPAVTSSPSGCGITDSLCPFCNQESIWYLNPDGTEISFDVYCDTAISEDADLNYYSPQEELSPTSCMNACDEFEGCLGALITNDDGGCILVRGETYNFIRAPGYIFLAITDTNSTGTTPSYFDPVPLLSETTSSPMSLTTVTSSLTSRPTISVSGSPTTLPPNITAATTSAIPTPTAPYGNTTTITPNVTADSTTSTSALDTTSLESTSTTESTPTCNPSAISCPSCDEQLILDNFNQTYRVFCDSVLFSSDPYASRLRLTPLECLASCSNQAWCGGSTWWTEGTCELARGENIFPVGASPGYTAFLPLITSAPAPTFPRTPVPIENPLSTLLTVSSITPAPSEVVAASALARIPGDEVSWKV